MPRPDPRAVTVPHAFGTAAAPARRPALHMSVPLRPPTRPERAPASSSRRACTDPRPPGRPVRPGGHCSPVHDGPPFTTDIAECPCAVSSLGHGRSPRGPGTAGALASACADRGDIIGPDAETRRLVVDMPDEELARRRPQATL